MKNFVCGKGGGVVASDLFIFHFEKARGFKNYFWVLLSFLIMIPLSKKKQLKI